MTDAGDIVFLRGSRDDRAALAGADDDPDQAAFHGDLLSDVPIARQHGSPGLVLAGKHVMGCAHDRGRMHTPGLSRTIAASNGKLKPDLTVLDAIRRCEV